MSPKIDISNKNWIIFNAKVFENTKQKFETLNEYKFRLLYQSLFSNLSSLSVLELLELRLKSLNYSLIR